MDNETYQQQSIQYLAKIQHDIGCLYSIAFFVVLLAVASAICGVTGSVLMTAH